jgi:hypothetical protein
MDDIKFSKVIWGYRISLLVEKEPAPIAVEEPPFDFEISDENKFELVLEDWKMAKDRIKSFNDQVNAIRISGIPLVLVIIAVGFVIIDKLNLITIPLINCNAAIIPFVFAALFTIPLCLLDIIYYNMLLKAVQHAHSIERREPFKHLICITDKITCPKLQVLHTTSLVALYGTIFMLCLILIVVFWGGMPAPLAHIIATNSSSVKIISGVL